MREQEILQRLLRKLVTWSLLICQVMA